MSKIVLNKEILESLINHNALLNYVAAQHLDLPNIIDNVLTDHDLDRHPLGVVVPLDPIRHERQHDHSLPEDGSPIAVAGVPDLPATKITSGRFGMDRMPDGISGFLRGKGAGENPAYETLLADDYPDAVLLDGSRYMTGNLNFKANFVTFGALDDWLVRFDSELNMMLLGLNLKPICINPNGDLTLQEMARLYFGLKDSVNLYRSPPNILTTDSRLRVNGVIIDGALNQLDLRGSQEGAEDEGAIMTLRGRTNPWSGDIRSIICYDPIIPNDPAYYFYVFNRETKVTTLLARLARTGQLQLPVAGSNAGILMGEDVNLYRSDVNVLKTDDILRVGATDLPTPSEDYRGGLCIVEGGTGVADVLYCCLKGVDDTYSWKVVTTG